jgi:zinc/manganese transport system permease protein
MQWLDPLFHLPLLTGMLLSVLLALLGVYLRLREEWLASLGLAQLASAGALSAAALGMPLLAGAALGAGLGAGGKSIYQKLGNDAYALMILLGWCLTLLIATNSAHGDELSHAVTDGQLYFTGAAHTWLAGILLLFSVLLLPWLSPRLLRARFFPDYYRANALPEWRYHFLFDLLCAAVLAAATASIGLMAAFALVFVPAWPAFILASGWRETLIIAIAFALITYLCAFALALWLDQAFGPVLVACVLSGAALVGGARHIRQHWQHQH